MRTISSKLTFFYKNATPIGWFVFIGLLFGYGIRSLEQFQIAIIIIVLPMTIIALIYAIQSDPKLVVVDRVIDAGNYLIIRYGKQEDRIELTNILNIYYFKRTPHNNLSSWLIKVQLKTAGKFGKEINFYPSVHVLSNPHPIENEINERIRNISRAASAKNIKDIEQL